MLRLILGMFCVLCCCGELGEPLPRDGRPTPDAPSKAPGDLETATALLELAQEIDKAVEEERFTQRAVTSTMTVYVWPWEATHGTEPKALEVTHDQREASTATALLRVCTSEAGFANLNDCTGIWEVTRNIRSRSCRRDLYPQITRCDDRGETEASTLRRLQRVILGDTVPQGRRARWVHALELDCAMPKAYPSDRHWEAVQARDCQRLARFVRHVASGGFAGRVTRPAKAIAWGGRCEVKSGACDDAIACARGLARIPNTETANAFWCRVGSPHCRQSPEPVCLGMGFRYAFAKPVEGKGRKIRAIHDPRRGPWNKVTDLGDPGRIGNHRGGLRLNRSGRGSRISETIVATRDLEAQPRRLPEERPVLDETEPVRKAHSSGGGLER